MSGILNATWRKNPNKHIPNWRCQKSYGQNTLSKLFNHTNANVSGLLAELHNTNNVDSILTFEWTPSSGFLDVLKLQQTHTRTKLALATNVIE